MSTLRGITLLFKAYMRKRFFLIGVLISCALYPLAGAPQILFGECTLWVSARGTGAGPAEMHFLSDGTLIIDSMIFSPRKEPYQLRYILEKEKLILFFTDPRIKDFLRIKDQEAASGNLISADPAKRSIAIRLEDDKSIFLAGWRFTPASGCQISMMQQ